MTTDILLGLMIPFAGTVLGAAMIFVLRREIGGGLQKLLLGFASGVMIAASVWSLLIPAIELSEGGNLPAWLPAALGFLLGIGFLLLLDSIIPHLHKNAQQAEGLPVRMGKSAMLILAVTLHNIPEGMAVGVVFAGVIAGTADIGISAALALSIGIALQNFPEGAIVSMPLKAAGMPKGKAFLSGALSGAVEPVAALITILLTGIMAPILPFLLAFAAGAMIYVVVEELIPELQEGGHSNIGIIGVAVGFVLMMVLDVALG